MVDRFRSTIWTGIQSPLCVRGFGQVGESVLVSSCVNQVKALLSGDVLGKGCHGCKGNPSHIRWVAPFPLVKALLDRQEQLRRHHSHMLADNRPTLASALGNATLSASSPGGCLQSHIFGI